MDRLVTLGLAFLLVPSLSSFLTGGIPSSRAIRQNDRPELVLQRGHSLGVNCAVFSPDGNLLASGGADNTIIIWQTASGRQLRTLTGQSAFRSIAISSNGRLLASGSNDGTIKIWNLVTGQEMFMVSGHTNSIESLAFGPGDQWLASGSADKTMKIWDLSTGKALRSFNKHKAEVSILTLSKDGSVLASSAGSEILLWDVNTWQLLTLRKHSAKVTSTAFSHDGNLFASATTDGAVMVGRVRSERDRITLKKNASSALALAFGPDGSLVTAHADGGLEAWDPNTGKEKFSLQGNRELETLVFACFSPDGYVLAASSGDRRLTLRGSADGDTRQILQSHSTSVNSVAFSPDGRWLASAANDSSIRLWQIATGRELSRLLGHAGYVTTVSFSPDSHFLASGSRSGEIKVWDVASGNVAFSLPTQPRGINRVEFSPDGKFLAAVGMEESVQTWDIERKKMQLLVGHTAEVTSVVFVDGGKILASAGRDKTIRLWDLHSGKLMKSLDNAGAEINALAISPDGRRLASANGDKTVRVWDIENPDPIKTLSGHAGEVLTVAFSLDSRLLASGSSDHSVVLWDLQSDSSRKLNGNSDSVTAVAFSVNGKWLLSGSDDGSIIVWSTSSAALMATLVSLPNADDWLVATPDGLFDGSPSSWNLMLWRFDEQTSNVTPVESFFNEFYYPGVLAEIFADNDPKPLENLVNKDRRQPVIKLAVSGDKPRLLETRQVDIELEVTAAPPDKDHTFSSGARDLRLFRNGLLVKTWSGYLLDSSGTRKLQTTVSIIAGENKFSAYAFNNDNIKSADAQLLVEGSNSLKRQGTAYLLLIGVEQYDNSQYNLKYPVADADEMGVQLREQQERLGRYKPIVTIPLFNAQATKRNILLALARLAGTNSETLPLDIPSALSKIRAAQPEDAVVIYFSGHGTAVRDHFYLIPHDLGYKGPRDALDPIGLTTILKHSISDEELEAALQPLDADQLLLVIDACKSGQAIESQEKRRGPMNTRGLAQLAYEKGIYVLTASQSIEVAFEAEALKHSYLAYALLEEGIKKGAADRNNDGDIFLTEWFDYANERVPQIRRTQYRQGRKELVEDELDEQRVQRPRVFYTREAGARQFLVARHLN